MTQEAKKNCQRALEEIEILNYEASAFLAEFSFHKLIQLKRQMRAEIGSINMKSIDAHKMSAKVT